LQTSLYDVEGQPLDESRAGEQTFRTSCPRASEMVESAKPVPATHLISRLTFLPVGDITIRIVTTRKYRDA
jgi:hypothetical protein